MEGGNNTCACLHVVSQHACNPSNTSNMKMSQEQNPLRCFKKEKRKRKEKEKRKKEEKKMKKKKKKKKKEEEEENA